MAQPWRGVAIICRSVGGGKHNESLGDSPYCSGVGLEGALPGVVVGIVVPFSVPVGDALQLLVTNIVVRVGVGSLSVDSLLSGHSHVGSVDGHSGS